MVVGTGAMRNKSAPIYYTFELDILFNSRLQTDSEQSSFEYALQNYKLLKGSDKMSFCEIEILKMLLERVQFGKKLIPNKIKLRKAFFILRNLVKTSYYSLDYQRLANLRVNPKAFFFNQGEFSSKLSLKRQQEMLKEMRTELAQGAFKKTASNQYGKYQNAALDKGGFVEKANMLMLEFKSNISFQ